MSSKKLLVIDDDPDVGLFCKTILEPLGYSVSTIFEAAHAIEKINEIKPDLIILDIILEEADSGIKLAREFPEKIGNIPVLLLSSIAKASEALIDVSSLPVKEVINKPIDPEVLIEKVKAIIG